MAKLYFVHLQEDARLLKPTCVSNLLQHLLTSLTWLDRMLGTIVILCYYDVMKLYLTTYI